MTDEPRTPPNALADQPSIDLINLFKAGDESALEVLFRRYLTPLQRWASGRLPRWARDIADTQDLVQDTFLQTFKRIELFEPERSGALQAYLRQAVMNRIRDEFRRAHRQPASVLIDTAHPSSRPSPYEEAVAAELVDEYESALARLPERDRDLLIGRIEMGLSYEELSIATERPNANAARTAFVRALIALAEAMDRD